MFVLLFFDFVGIFNAFVFALVIHRKDSSNDRRDTEDKQKLIRYLSVDEIHCGVEDI